jgi:hypothetical protein
LRCRNIGTWDEYIATERSSSKVVKREPRKTLSCDGCGKPSPFVYSALDRHTFTQPRHRIFLPSIHYSSSTPLVLIASLSPAYILLGRLLPPAPWLALCVRSIKRREKEGKETDRGTSRNRPSLLEADGESFQRSYNVYGERCAPRLGLGKMC